MSKKATPPSTGRRQFLLTGLISLIAGLFSSRSAAVSWRLSFTILQERFDSQEDRLKILRQRSRPAALYLLKSRE